MNERSRMKERNRIVRRYDRLIREVNQIIVDANYWNGLPHNQQHTPLDVESDRVLLAKLRSDRAAFVAANPA